MAEMKPSGWLYTFLREHERFRPTAYKPTKNDKWTCGYGHTGGVTPTTTCTAELAGQWLAQDMLWAAEAVSRHVTVPLTQPQFDALCSLTFNIGATAFEESTLLRKLNDGEYGAAADEFLRWDHQHGRIITGLLERRQAERERFLEQSESLIS